MNFQMRLPAWKCLDGASLFKDQIVLISGAASGIGRACAHMFAEQSAHLILVDLDKTALKVIAEDLESTENRVLTVKADLNQMENIDILFSEIEDFYGDLDIVINNAGGGLPTDFFLITLEEWNSILNLNLTSIFAISQQAANIFRKKSSGCIINISSLAGRSVSVTAGCHYTASKAGVLGLTRHMARTLAPFQIRVNAVCPGVINSSRILNRLEQTGELDNVVRSIPLGRLGDVSEVATCCLFLASDLAGFVTGISLDVNGGALML
jgi:NAD(P)-dependent dehydrogenase (short-subunit alcohol dehydrogenase family)